MPSEVSQYTYTLCDHADGYCAKLTLGGLIVMVQGHHEFLTITTRLQCLLWNDDIPVFALWHRLPEVSATFNMPFRALACIPVLGQVENVIVIDGKGKHVVPVVVDLDFAPCSAVPQQ